MAPSQNPNYPESLVNEEYVLEHLSPFRSRTILSLPVVSGGGWQLKRYAILADEKTFDESIAVAAGQAALNRLPDAGQLSDGVGNHGVGFQIVHFAEIAVVSPVFYWQWGNVLANIEQMRAQWGAPTNFGNGVNEVVGCIWEMDIVNFEISTWKTTLLSEAGTPEERLAAYIARDFVR